MSENKKLLKSSICDLLACHPQDCLTDCPHHPVNHINLLKKLEKMSDNNGWISVEDRLPEHGNVCLCVDYFGSFIILKWWGEIFQSWTYANCNDISGIYSPMCGMITHWQLLPEPPIDN